MDGKRQIEEEKEELAPAQIVYPKVAKPVVPVKVSPYGQRGQQINQQQV